jgi:5'-3' exonuclease
MGIPRFFYWLYKEYPYVMTKIHEKDTLLKHKINIDTYALDLNAIVHPICQQVFSYGQYKNGPTNGGIKRLIHSKKEINIYSSKRIECYNKICEKIDELVNIVNPRKKIILALDGTAGMSKQYQQRQRRYRAVIDNPTDTNHKQKEFDSNEITTGSVFMNELSQCINEYISYKVKNGWKELDIYFSSEQVPGEGEHKIMHLLKQYSSFGSYCIHSPDADLIMLSLSSLCTHEFKKCYIMRDNIYQHVFCKYFIVDVNLFSDMLINKFKNFSINSKKQHFISDFILYCFFFGNDFLPENPLMITDKSGIDMLFLLYNETLINYGNLTKINNNKIVLNLDECIYFFEKLSNNEQLFYNKKYNKNNKLTNEHIIEQHISDENSKYNELENFKKEYYKDKLNFDVDNPLILTKQLNKLCNEYLRGIQFVLLYYLYDIPDWYWFYPYHYAPFFSDICNYLKSLKIKRLCENSQQLDKVSQKETTPTKNVNNILSFKFEKNEPLTPFEQLLAVLPPESSTILPEQFEKLMTDNNSPINLFYPETDSIKIEIKSEYEKTILVPFIDVKLLRNTFNKTFQENKNILSEIAMKRNEFIKTKNYINSTKLKL